MSTDKVLTAFDVLEERYDARFMALAEAEHACLQAMDKNIRIVDEKAKGIGMGLVRLEATIESMRKKTDTSLIISIINGCWLLAFTILVMVCLAIK